MEDMLSKPSDVQFWNFNTGLIHTYKLVSHQHTEVDEIMNVPEINSQGLSAKSHGWDPAQAWESLQSRH